MSCRIQLQRSSRAGEVLAMLTPDLQVGQLTECVPDAHNLSVAQEDYSWLPIAAHRGLVKALEHKEVGKNTKQHSEQHCCG